MKPRTQASKWLEAKTAGRTKMAFKAGAKIFSQGESAKAVFFVREGTVKYQVRSLEGKQAIIALFNPGEYFGLGCIMGARAYSATAWALTDCSLVKIESAEMLRLLREDAAAAKLFMTYLLTRVSRYQEDLADFRFSSSERRLARLLLSLAQFKATSRSRPIIPRLHQQELADMVGTTRSRVNYFMNRFRKLGLIDYGRHIKVHRALRDLVALD